jgi:hypothetical protein
MKGIDKIHWGQLTPFLTWQLRLLPPLVLMHFDNFYSLSGVHLSLVVIQ